MGSDSYTTELIKKALEELGENPSASAIAAELELQSKINNHHIWQSKDNKWRAHVYIDGKRKMLVKNTRADLLRAVRKYYQNDFAPYFEKMYTEMIADKKGELKKNSVTKYNNNFNRFFKSSKHELLTTRVNLLTDNILEDFIITTIRSLKLKHKAYKDMETILRETLRYAKRKGFTNYSVVTFFNDLELPRSIWKYDAVIEEDPVLTTEQVIAIREECRKRGKAADSVIELMTFTGMRIGEAVAVSAADLSNDGMLTINKTEMTYSEGDKPYTIISPEAKLGHNRRIPIVERAKELVKKGPFEVTTRQVRYRFKQIVATLKLDKSLHPHCIRAWFISYLSETRDFSDPELTMLVGHKDISTTRRYYLKNIQTKEKTKNSLEKHLGEEKITTL